MVNYSGSLLEDYTRQAVIKYTDSMLEAYITHSMINTVTVVLNYAEKSVIAYEN